jgi:hypothetical protein
MSSFLFFHKTYLEVLISYLGEKNNRRRLLYINNLE